jgi:serine/threonine-protein kinase
MGVIYRARDQSLGRDVAVKVLHERYRADSLVGQRFLDEARITAQLQHPGIPPVFEVGRLEDERPYLAMKLIKGRTLAHLLEEGSNPASGRGRFLAIFEQICQAVGYAHSKHILHRDLKPANVMVGAFGEVQVMDWGLAKLLQPVGKAAHEPGAGTETSCGTVVQTAREPDCATLAGSLLGTPAFMAPEQAGGEVNRLDERADVFGLGAILCVILTGQPPYTAKSGAELQLMAVRGALAGAETRLEQCGADAKLVELCRRCLSVEPEARPRDGGAVAATIAGYLAGVEERARQAELERAAAEARSAELRKRRRVQLALAAAVLVLLGLVGFALWWQERLEATAAAEYAARVSRTSAGVTEAAREARGRIAEAWNLADSPDRMQHTTAAAVAALRRAEDSVDGGAPDETALTDLASTRRELNELARYTRLIRALTENSHKVAQEVSGEGWWEAEGRLALRHGEALRDFGLDPLREPVDEVAQAVASSRLRDVLLAALLDWHWHDGGQQQRQRLWRVIRSARQRSGGAYVRWQKLLDDKDVRGLMAFAASPDGLSFRSGLSSALFRDLRDARQYAAARTFARAAIDRYPHDVRLQLDLADLCLLRMYPPEYTETLQHISAAAALRPDSAVFHLYVGDCYVGLGSYEQAFVSYRKAIELGRGAVVGYVHMADALAKRNDWDGAIAVLAEASRLQPKNAAARLELGTGKADWSRPLGDDAFVYACLLLICGDSEGYNRVCQGMIERAADTKDHFESFVLARSCAMARASPVEATRAVQWANQARAGADHGWYVHALGLAHYRAGQFDQALQRFTESKGSTGCRELNWFGLALVHHRLGHADEARRYLEQGIDWLETEGVVAKLLPCDWLEAQLLRREAEEILKTKRSRDVRQLGLAQGRRYILLSQWDQAAAEYAKADLLTRPLRDDALGYACLFLIRGDAEGYNRFYQDMIQRLAPMEAPWEAYILARSCAMARKSPVDPARTVQWANQAVAGNHHPWYFHTLGLAQYRAGQFDQALQSFTKADIDAWRRSVNWFGLALVHHRLGQPDRARQYLDKGIQWLEQEGPPVSGRPARIHPVDWLEAQLLRREAEETLKIKRSP